MTYAETLNRMGWEMIARNNLAENYGETNEFCLVNTSEHALEVSNEFVTEFLPKALEK
jgi:hypothetical protein